jgi:ABC-type cobalamin/Fe3+-siderophores transport system ATPase subunit
VQAAGRPEEVITEEHILAAFGVRVVCDRNPATGTVRVTPVRRGAGNTIRPGEREDR